MEVTTPICGSYHQGDLLRDIITRSPSNNNLNLKLAFLLKNESYAKKDALLAVKLDPAVLEAQVTIGTDEKALHEAKSDETHTTSQEGSSTGTDSPVKLDSGFEAMLSMQRAALQSLSSQQFDLLLRYVDTLRKQRLSVQKQMECAFCKNNGKALAWYTSHALRDSKGRVRCPVLRAFRCPRCGATGDRAHTIRYCPQNELRS